MCRFGVEVEPTVATDSNTALPANRLRGAQKPRGVAQLNHANEDFYPFTGV